MLVMPFTRGFACARTVAAYLRPPIRASNCIWDEFTRSYMTRVVRLAFLAPAVVDAILEGKSIVILDGMALTAPSAVVMDWSVQRRKCCQRLRAVDKSFGTHAGHHSFR